MQIKIIKKILAVMIVASAISTSPGIVSAYPPKNDAKKENFQKNESENRPNSNLSDSNDNFIIAKPEAKKQPVIETKNQEQNVLKSLLDDQIPKINDILSKPFNSEIEREYFVKTIKNFSKHCFFKEWAKIKIDNILVVLRSCLTSQDLQPDISEIILNMIKVGCFENWPENKISDVLTLLKQCSHCAAAKKNVSAAISSFVNKKFLETCSGETIFNFVAILVECSRDMGNELNIASIVKYLVSSGCFKAYDQRQICGVMTILNNCAGNDLAKKYVACSVKYLIDLEHIHYWQQELIDILDKCSVNSEQSSNFFSSAKDVISAISRLVERGFLEKCSQKSASTIMNILFRCSSCDCDESEIENIVKYLQEKGHLKNWMENNVAAKQISGLFKNSESYFESNGSCNSSYDQISQSADDGIELDESKQKPSNETSKSNHDIVIELSNKSQSNETSKSNHDILIDLSNKRRKRGKNSKTKTLNKPQISLIGKKTTRDDEEKASNKNLEEELKNLVKEECSQSGHVGNLSDDKISKIIQMLRQHLDNGGSKKFIAMTIYQIANRNLLKNFSKSKILQIIYILDECSDDVAAKKFVANDIAIIIKKDLLSNFSTSELKNVKKILIKCLNSNDAKAFVALAIMTFAEKRLTI